MDGADVLRGILRPGFPDLQSRGEVVAAARALRDAGVSGDRLLQLRSPAPRAISPGLRTRSRRSEDDRGVSRTRSSPSPARRAASARSCAGISAEQGAAIAALDRSETVTATSPTSFAPTGTRSRRPSSTSWMRTRSRPAFATARRAPRRRRHPDQQRRRVAQSEPRAHDARRDFSDDVNANLNGAYNCTHAVLPAMKARRSGVDRQRRFGQRTRRARRRRLQRGQGRPDQPDQGAGAGIRPLQHPREHRLPGHGAHADLWNERVVPQPGSADAARALVSARPHRRADRGHARGRLPRLRRRFGDHRRRAAGRLRPDRPATSSWRAS